MIDSTLGRSARRGRSCRPEYVTLVALLAVSPAAGALHFGGYSGSHGSLLLGSAPSLLVTGSAGCPAWSPLAPPTEDQPYPRAAFALAFDSQVGLGVLYGGINPAGHLLNDTWVNDGDFPGRWANFSTVIPSGPPALEHASLAFDRLDGYFVLFGGTLSNGSVYGGTWLFQNFRWTDLTPGLRAAPPAEAGAAMTYDASAGWVLLESGIGTGATWVFHGRNWSLLPGPPGPSPRENAVLTYDPVLHADLLVAGTSNAPSSAALNDTWMLNGTTWRSVGTGPRPPGGPGDAATFDPRVNVTLLLTSNDPTQLWWFQSGQWRLVPGSQPGAPPPRLGGGWYYDRIVGFDTVFAGMDPTTHRFLVDQWGWEPPQALSNPCWSPSPVPASIVIGVVAVLAIPVAWSILSRRRPPGKAPVSVPRARARQAPAI